jgi:hypothetical protein
VTVTACDICGGADLVTVLHLGSSPPTCNMPALVGPETHYPLALIRCQDCGLVMLSEKVDPAELFPPDYPYSSGNSAELHENFEDLARQIDPAPDDLLVDIGANDGTLLSKFDCRKIGVEPTAQSYKISKTTTTAVHAPFAEPLARQIVRDHGHADHVTACNVLAHVPDLDDAMRGIAVLLGNNGTLWAENQDLAALVAGGQWDTVYHEHLRFFDPATIIELLRRHGLAAQTLNRIPTHGGSFRVSATQGESRYPLVWTTPDYDFDALGDAALRTRYRLRHRSEQMVGIGATARATTVINYCGLDVEDLEFVAEVSGSDKIGRLIPGTRIPVVDEEELLTDQKDAVLFSWHLADKIVPALRGRGYEGRIYTPIPHFQELDG